MRTAPLTRGLDVESQSQHMRESLREQAIAKPLAAWGVVNVALTVVQMFMNSLGSSIGLDVFSLNKYFMLNVAAWIAVAIATRSATLRLPAGILLLLGVQVWFTFSTVVSQTSMGRQVAFSPPDYSLVTFVLAFLQGALLVQIAPKLRRGVFIGLAALCAVSAVVAVMQFLNVGPAIELANRMVGQEDITNWAGQGGVRAVGIWPGVILPVHYNLIAIGIMCAALFYRKLKPWEIALVIGLAAVMFMSQVRNATVLIALVMLPLIALFIRRHKEAAVPYVVAGVLVMLAMVTTGGDRFQYLFSGDTSTFDYRRDVLWPQAKTIYETRPWTGIGVEPTFAGFFSPEVGRYSDGRIMDNGYFVALTYGGLPALSLLVLSVVASIIGAIALVLRPAVDRWQRGFALGTLVIALAFGYGMFFGNMITNASLGMPYFLLAGMGLPSFVPGRKKLVKPRRLVNA